MKRQKEQSNTNLDESEKKSSCDKPKRRRQSQQRAQLEAFEEDAQEIAALLQAQAQDQAQVRAIAQVKGNEEGEMECRRLERFRYHKEGTHIMQRQMMEKPLMDHSVSIIGNTGTRMQRQGLVEHVYGHGLMDHNDNNSTENGATDGPSASHAHVPMVGDRAGGSLPQSHVVTNMDVDVDDRIWLAPRQRRVSRIGSDFQATLPNP